MASKREERRRARDQRRVESSGTTPEQYARASKRGGVKDAFCPQCKTWYDSSNDAQVDRHAH